MKRLNIALLAALCAFSIVAELAIDSTSSFIRIYSPADESLQLGLGEYLKEKREQSLPKGSSSQKSEKKGSGKGVSAFSISSHCAASESDYFFEPVINVSIFHERSFSIAYEAEWLVPLRPPIS